MKEPAAPGEGKNHVCCFLKSPDFLVAFVIVH